jgi:hypothetical protein
MNGFVGTAGIDGIDGFVGTAGIEQEADVMLLLFCGIEHIGGIVIGTGVEMPGTEIAVVDGNAGRDEEFVIPHGIDGSGRDGKGIEGNPGTLGIVGSGTLLVLLAGVLQFVCGCSGVGAGAGAGNDEVMT